MIFYFLYSYFQKKKMVDHQPRNPSLNSRRWAGGFSPLPHNESRMKSALPAAEVR